MTKIFLIFAIALMSVVLGIGSSSIVMADEEGEGQEFLYMLEEGYVMERGKYGVSLSAQYMDGKKSREVEYEGGDREDTLKIKGEWCWVFGVEYGFLDWLTIEVETPFVHIDKTTSKEEDSRTVTELDKTGIGDVEVGFKVRVFENDKDSYIPATSLGFKMSLPTGNWKKDLGSDHLGFELGLALSKTLEKFAYHLNLAGGYVDNAREEGESGKIDEVELECGIGLVYMPSENLDLIGEVYAEFEREYIAGEYNYGTKIYLVPGIAYEFEEFMGGLDIGVGVPIGLTYESYDWGVILKVMRKF